MFERKITCEREISYFFSGSVVTYSLIEEKIPFSTALSSFPMPTLKMGMKFHPLYLAHLSPFGQNSEIRVKMFEEDTML